MIQLQVENESKLYNSLDPSRKTVSDEVYRYIKSFCTLVLSSSISPEPVIFIAYSPLHLWSGVG